MKKNILLVLIVLLVLSSSLTAIGAEYRIWQPNLKIEGRLKIDEITGKGDIIYPLTQNEDSVFYTDVRAMFNGSNATEYNLGLGYRQILENKDYILGGYIFKDLRRQFDVDWNQWTVGGELLTKDVDLRLNLYFPQDNSVLIGSSPADEIMVVGNSVVYQQAVLDTYYNTMKGYDIELGKRFYPKQFDNIGVYYRYFSFSNENKSLSGNGIKVDTQYEDDKNNLWTIGLDWQDDNVRGSSIEATVSITVPLGESNKKEKNKLEERMLETPNRDIDIIVSEDKTEKKVIAEEQAIDSETNAPVSNIWYVTANGDGTGTFEDPTNLADLFEPMIGIEGLPEDTFGPYDIIVLLGDDGEIDTAVVDSLELYPGHKLLSPGGYLELGSASNPENKAIFIPEGKQATLINSTQNSIIELTADNTVSGIIFDGKEYDNYYGIDGTDFILLGNNFNIHNNSFINLHDAIVINDYNNEMFPSFVEEQDITLNIHNNYFDQISDDALYINIDNYGFDNNNINIENNEFGKVNDSAIRINSYALNNSIVNVNNNILNKVQSAIEIDSYTSSDMFRSSHVNVIGNTINTALYNSINVYSYSNTDSIVNISDNYIDISGSGNGDLVRLSKIGGEAAISLYNSAKNNVESIIANNTINNSNGGGIAVIHDYSSTWLNEQDLTNPDTKVVFTTVIENNNIGEVLGDGIYVRSRFVPINSQESIDINNNSINFSGSKGIGIDTIPYFYYNSDYTQYEYTKVTDINVADNSINKTFGDGIFIVGANGGKVNTNVISNSVYNSNGYGIAFTVFPGIQEYYDNGYTNYFYPTNMDVISFNNNYINAKKGGILIFEGTGGEAEATININKEQVPLNNTFHSDVDPIITEGLEETFIPN